METRKEFLALLDNEINTLTILDLWGKTIYNKVKYDTEGPDGVGSVSNFFVVN